MLNREQKLLPLLLWRVSAATVVLWVVAWFYLPSFEEAQKYQLLYISLAFIGISGVHVALLQYAQGASQQIFFQFSSDIVLIAFLTFITGGYQSPLSLLFGLVIVAAGTQARVILVLSMAVLACIAYLSSIYTFEWLHADTIPSDATLKLLLQISVFLLVGGVMAAIARRHANLSSESLRVTQEHRDFQRLHTQLMASMQEGVLVLDRELRVLDSNPAVRDIFPMPNGVTLRLSDFPRFPDPLIAFMRGTMEGSMRSEWQKGDATYLVTVGHFPKEQLGAYGWVTFVDVSELRHLERQLAAQERLAAMGRMAAMLAHELRNPMQTIAQAVELVTVVPVEKQKNIQSIVAEEVMRLNRLVTDMLNYARPMEARLENVDVAQLLQEVLLDVDPLQRYQIQSQIGLAIMYVDKKHVRIVLDNLLRHAISASPESASVMVSFQGDVDHWHMRIADHGDMIEAEMRQKMFEPFGAYRGGTGLGLATVWQLCEANGWRLDVESGAQVTVLCISADMGHDKGEGHG